MKISSRVFLGRLACCVALLATPSVRSAESHSLRVGVAKLDITPRDLTGVVSVSNRPFKGVREPIFARALVLDDGTTLAAIVALDFVEYGDSHPLRERISRELGIPADHIMIAASHDHSAPRGGPPTPGTSSMQGRPSSSPAFTKQAEDTIVEALRRAKESLQPARFGLGTGEADINTYRYAYVDGRWRAGFNPTGPSDKTVWVLKFETLSGEPIALMMNYAVHSNVMTGAGQKENEDMIWGDISGSTERYVEKHFQDKVVVLWTLGAAGDQYAKFNKEGDKIWADTPATELVDVQAHMLGLAVLETANRVAAMTPSVHIQAAERAVACAMKPPNPPAGSAPAAPVSSPGTLDMHLGLIRLNGLAITSVSGEVSTNIYAHLQRESPFKDTMMVTLANDRVGYIPDEQNWERMGAAYVRGCAEEAIVKNLTEMMRATIQ